MPRYDYPWSSKTTVEESLKISTKFLREQGYLLSNGRYGSITWSRYGEVEASATIHTIMDSEPRLVLRYTNTNYWTDEKKDLNYEVRLTSTECNFSGVRWWFECLKCWRRVMSIYKTGGELFLCRHCYDLTYASRNKNRRGQWGWLSQLFDVEEKFSELWNEGKYLTYAGKPTKRLKRLHSLRLKSNYAGHMLKAIGFI